MHRYWDVHVQQSFLNLYRFRSFHCVWSYFAQIDLGESEILYVYLSPFRSPIAYYNCNYGIFSGYFSKFPNDATVSISTNMITELPQRGELLVTLREDRNFY